MRTGAQVTWDVLAACHHLVRQELVVEGEGRNRGIFTLQK